MVAARAERGHSRRWLGVALATLGLGALGACGGSDSNTRTSDVASDVSDTADVATPAPTLVIVAPTEGLVAPAGSSVELVATVAQAGADLTTLSVEWTTDRASGILARITPDANGRTAATMTTLAPGAHALTATATDAAGQHVSSTVHIVLDVPPTAPVVAIEPPSPKTDDALHAAITTAATDPDGDVTTSYRWLKDGVDSGLQTADVPAAATAKGELWKVVVSATDSGGNTVTASAEVTIGNSAPTCGQALVLPSAGTTTTAFTCSCPDRADADGASDAKADTCTFLVDGQPLAADGACALDPALTERDMVITCTLTPADDEDAGTPVDSASFDVLNAAPSAPAVTLAPTEATAVVDATTELTCSVATPGVDPDGDPVSHLVTWTIDGVTATLHGDPAVVATVVAGDLAVPGVDAAPDVHARHGDEIRCAVRASDGTSSSAATVSAPLTLANAAPFVDGVLVTPVDLAGAVEGHAVKCGAGTTSDADGDTLILTYAWLVDDVVVAGQTGDTLTSDHFAKGDVLRCTVAASDGIDSSDPVASKNQLTVKNSPPAITGASLTPAAPKKTDTLTCSYAGWSDADGDSAAVTYAWEIVVGAVATPVAGQTGATLAGSAVPVGSAVRCVVTPTDGSDAGAPVTSNAVTLENTLPTLTSATLGPADARVGSTLTCTPVGFADADGDAPVYSYSWTKNAQAVAGQSAATLAGAFGKGDHVRCVVTPGDGVATGTAATSNEVVIGNTLPTLASVTLTPSAGSLCATYTCTSGAVSDPDASDLTSLAYRWERNGVALAGQSAATLSATAVGLVAGDQLRCFAAPADGTLDAISGLPVYGIELPSSAAHADNAPPSLAAATLSPSTAGVGTTLTCAGTGWQDDCTASPSLSYAWYVDNALVAGASAATFATDDLALGAAVRCRATPKDALASGTPVDSAPVTLGPGEAVAPVVMVTAPDGAAGDATCVITTPAKWFDQPTYTWYWSVNGVETVGTQTLSGTATHDCDLLACRVVVQDARSSLTSAPASLQLAVGADCEDGNDCTSHVCNPAGGCAAPVPESGNACVHPDLCRPLGTCDEGECVATGSVCFEEPLATVAAGFGQPEAIAYGDGGYAVQWNAQDLRATDAQDSRLDETTSIDAPVRTYGTIAYSRPVQLADGTLFGMTLSGCVRAGHPNNSDACTLYGSTVDKAGTATVSAITVGYSSNQGCGGIIAPDTRALDLGGVRAAIYSTSYRYYQSSAPSGCKGVNEGLRFISYDGTGAGVEKTLVATTQSGLDYWAVTNVAFDAASTPPGSDAFEVVWIGGDGKTLYARRFGWTAGALTSGTQITVTTAAAAIGDPHVAGFFDGTFIVGWSEGGDAWVQRFDSDGQLAGAKLRVNDVTTGTQSLGGLATFYDFGFVAVWQDSRSDGTADTGVRAQRFDAAAVPEGPATNLNTLTVGTQGTPSVAALSDDQWVASWYDNNLGQIMTRRFERDGTPASGVREVMPAETTVGDQARPKAATSKQGTTLVVWETPLYVGADSEIGARLYTRSALGDARPVTGELQLNVETASTQRWPAVAGGDDRFVVAWESLNEDGSSYGIVARIFDAQAKPVTDPFVVNTTRTAAQTRPAVAIRQDGTILIAWQTFVSGTDPSDIVAKAYDKNGVQLVGETVVPATTAKAQERAVVIPWTSGFLVGWESNGQITDGGYDLFARTVAVSGSTFAFGSERQIDANTVGNQRNLALALSPSGYLAACWDGPDAGGTLDVVCQTFTASTFAVKTPEFTPEVATTGNQEAVALGHDGSGRLVVAWETEGVDTAGRAILARFINSQGPASGVRVMTNRTQLGDQTRPFVSALPDGDVWFGWQSAAQDGSGASVVLRLLPSP
ncbi:MAG: hypothetical protein U1F43_09575 [Myxococcota bacterium]